MFLSQESENGRKAKEQDKVKEEEPPKKETCPSCPPTPLPNTVRVTVPSTFVTHLQGIFPEGSSPNVAMYGSNICMCLCGLTGVARRNSDANIYFTASTTVQVTFVNENLAAHNSFG